jgi:hypothetical protein
VVQFVNKNHRRMGGWEWGWVFQEHIDYWQHH